MTLNDFASAVDSYPADSVQLSIVDVAGPGNVNINEVFSFQVRVRNNGHLNMRNVSLHISGQNGASVGTTALAAVSAAVNNSITFGNLSVNGHGGQQDTVNLFFQAPNAAKAAGTILVNAHISGWNANLDDILNGHSGHASTPSGTLVRQVFPS